MRKAEFNVPSEAMAEFAEEMSNRNLSNTVAGANEEGEIIVEVQYDRDEADEVNELEDILDKLREELVEESEEEEDK